MEYEISKGRLTSLKIGLIWNAIALVLNFIILPIYYQLSVAETVIFIGLLMVITLPVLGLDYYIYRKVSKKATKPLIIIGLCLSLVSVLALIKTASIILVVTYIVILIKDKKVVTSYVVENETDAVDSNIFEQ